MNTSQKDHQEIPPHLEQKKLIEFLESLHRIFKIGIYYPAGHKVLDQAAEKFQRNISNVADTNRSVLIELQNETLHVAGNEISTPTSALHEFKKLILDLGIGSIEIDRAIPLPELLQLVSSLLLGRSQLQGIKEFTQADIANLPASVRILQKEFLVDESAILPDGNGDDAEHGLHSVFQALAEQGVERDRIEQCKKFLQTLADRFSSRPFAVKGLPPVTWNDVRGLLVKVVTTACQRSGGAFTQNELNSLSTIFQGLGMEMKDKEHQETINFLISVFDSNCFDRKQLEAAACTLSGNRPADNTIVQSARQLQTFVNENFVPRKTLEKLNRIDRREELAVLLQLLQFKQEPPVEGKIRQNLRDILTTPLNDREAETLTRGVMYLASCPDSSRFYDAMHFLAILMRSAKNFSSQQFLAMIFRRVSPAAQTHLWPILVNEILASGRAEQKVFSQLVDISARLPRQEMKGRWPELEAMDCFQEKKIAADIFDPELKNSFPLFSFLLGTSMKRPISARILIGLMARPPDWLIEAVAPLLQLAIPQHLKFLQIYLLAAQQEYFSDNVRMAAGTLVVHHLPEVSEQQMREAWVVKTIRATPEIQVEETRPLLERIIEEKHMFIVPKWPNACRRAAAEALKILRRRLR